MNLTRNLCCAATITVILFAGVSAQAVDDQENLNKVLRQLDAAAATFTSTQADFEFDTVTTEPIPDKDIQKGTAYYQRKNATFQMAAHIKEQNGKSAPKTYTYAGGVLKLYDEMLNQERDFAKAGKFESYLMLGFGASGKALEDKWTITYKGSETLDGVKTEILELVAKDPDVQKNIPKVTIWVDTARAVSLKQVFDEGSGNYRVCVYFNIKVNQSLPGDAFVLKTNSKTEFIKQ